MRYEIETVEDLKTRTTKVVVFGYDTDNVPAAVEVFGNTAVGRRLAREKVDQLESKVVDTNVK